MNCKPGGLAIIVKVMPLNPDALGMIVEVLEVSPSKLFQGGYVPACLIQTRRDLLATSGRKRSVGWVKQSTLRPIRDLGDDFPDESTAWLPPVPCPALEGI